MTVWAVLATGPSMSQDVADFVRGRCRVAAVSDAYRLAPWADALVSNDVTWWRVHSAAVDASGFAGRRFGAARFTGVEIIPPTGAFTHGVNSGLQGMRVAEMLGAKLILLLGFDMRGAHFFGKHPAPLKNTTPERFRVHLAQFKKWAGCPVINCTPGSALEHFPFGDVRTLLS